MSLADDVLDRAAELRRRGDTFVVATVVRVEPPTSAQAGDKALITADGKLWGWVGGSCSEGLVRREALVAMGDGQPRLVKIAPAEPNASTWAVVATMGHYDEDAIEALLRYDIAYIGLVASRRRAATVLGVLQGRGVLGLERVRRAADSSVGGSQEEIALATLAEIAAERHAHQRHYAIPAPETAIDPICGMQVEVKRAMHALMVGEATYYFCGAGCLDAFRLREGQSISG